MSMTKVPRQMGIITKVVIPLEEVGLEDLVEPYLVYHVFLEDDLRIK